MDELNQNRGRSNTRTKTTTEIAMEAYSEPIFPPIGENCGISTPKQNIRPKRDLSVTLTEIVQKSQNRDIYPQFI